MKGWLTLAALALFVSNATVAAVPDAPITFTLNSWGKPLTRWTIRPDGSIRRTVAEGKEIDRFTLVTSETPASPPRYRWVADLLKRVRGATIPCNKRAFDMPYGSVRWGNDDNKASATDYNVGCLDRSAAHYLDVIARADRQVGIWTAKDGKIVATEKVGTPDQAEIKP